MSITQFKCPSCGGAVVFDPSGQTLVCTYCKSPFTVEDFNKEKSETESFENEAVSYVCGNCGAEIITTPTTAATFCCYCHTPVVLDRRLDGSQKPDYVLPFKISKETALERFRVFFGSKKMLPQDFKNKVVLDKISGVYYPYWFTDSDVGADLSSTAKKVRIWRSGNYRYTETKTYSVVRSGNLDVDAVSEAAIENARVNLNEVCPFDDQLFKDFSMAYFSGFMAEKKTLEKNAVAPKITDKIKTLTYNALSSTIGGYDSVINNSFNIDVRNTVWKYVLLPVWVLTFNASGKEYIYAVNGQTGTLYGELPTDKKKLNWWSFAILIASVLVGALIGVLAGGIAL